MEPTIRPALGSSPKTSAMPMPSAFCRKMNTVASTSRIISGHPPLINWRMSDFKPMPAKKYSSMVSRTCRSNSTWMLRPKYKTLVTAAQTKPPTTDSGMQYWRSNVLCWTSVLPRKSSRIASVKLTRP
ncbi:hypothetical protein D9M71_588580 [compost metagenome]